MNAVDSDELRKAFDGLKRFLSEQYIRCGIVLESDVQALTYAHLRKTLDPKKWIIWNTTTLFPKHKPDIVIYKVSSIASFLRTKSPEKQIAALVEIKYNSNTGSIDSDLKKLIKMRERLNGNVLLWMIFGGHFQPTIHKRYAKQHETTEKVINVWIKGAPRIRNAVILKMGQCKGDKKLIKLLNSSGLFWIQEKRKKSI